MTIFKKLSVYVTVMSDTTELLSEARNIYSRCDINSCTLVAVELSICWFSFCWCVEMENNTIVFSRGALKQSLIVQSAI